MSSTHCWWWWEWGWRRRLSGWVLLTVVGGEWGWRRRLSVWVLLTVDGGESEDEEGGCLYEFYSLLMVVRVRMKKKAVWMSSTHCCWWWEWGWRRKLSGWGVRLTGVSSVTCASTQTHSFDKAASERTLQQIFYIFLYTYIYIYIIQCCGYKFAFYLLFSYTRTTLLI